MTMSLMSMFDPLSPSVLGYKWYFLCFILMIWHSVFSNFYSSSTGTSIFLKKMTEVLVGLMSEVFKHASPGFLGLTTLFLVVFILNETSMMPFSFTVTSHLVFNLSLSIPLWLSGLLVMKLKQNLSHLVPLGSPLPLSFFLVLIESVSLLSRPISLGIRLMANMMAGHMILALVESYGSMLYSFLPSLIISSGFLAFEIGVGIVQAFVFFNLMFMYWSESLPNKS